MTTMRRPRRTLGLFVFISCALHALAIFCIPVGPAGETVGERVIRQVRFEGIEFVKTIRPKPKPKPRQPVAKRSKRTLHVRRRRVVRRVVRRIRRPKSEPKPLEAQVLPPPKPEEQAGPPPVEEVISEPQPMPVEEAKSTPSPEPMPEPEPPPPVPETPERLAMAPQPVAPEPRSAPQPAEVAEKTAQAAASSLEAKAPTAPAPGEPEIVLPSPASGGDAKKSPQIGLAMGREERSALPGTVNRVGTPETVAGPGGPVPRIVSPNPGGSSGPPRLALLPRDGSGGPTVQRGTPTAPDSLGAPTGRPGPTGPPGKRSPGSPGTEVGPTMGTGRSQIPSPGSGDRPGPAGPGQPLALMTSPRGAFSVPPLGAGGRDEAGEGGGGGSDIILVGGGGLEIILAGGPGGGGGGGGRGDKARPGLGTLWGDGGGSSRYARGRGGGPGGGLSGGGVGTGTGDGAGPGSGIGEPIVIAMVGPGGGYGQGNTPLPLGWPGGTATTGAPGFPWLEPGLGRGGGGGLGLFGGPDGYGSGAGYPSSGAKLTPVLAGIPGGMGPETRVARTVGGQGEGQEPGGPGWYGPLQVGGGPGGTGPGGGLVGFMRGGLGIPVLPPSIVRPLAGIHGGFGTPGGGSATGATAVAKEAPGGIYADLVGTFDIPVGVTNSDYNTDEVSVLNLLNTMRERTKVRVTIDNRYVPITYDAIKDAPLLWISGHKPFTWTDQEREALRKYVENGGTLLVEDCHGPFNQVFPFEVRRIFGRELEPIPLDDELFRSFYVMNELPAGDVQERLPIRGLRMPDGRLGVIYSPNDYSDAWKVPRGSYVGDAQKEQAYRMGINMYIYVLAHWRRGQQTTAAPRLPRTP